MLTADLSFDLPGPALPAVLYHYTSVSSLALILKGKKMKFSPLNTVDDLLEGNSSDAGQMGRYVFVSCWTDDSQENIALWKMYTPEMKGVRLGLPCCPLFEVFDHREFRECLIYPRSGPYKVNYTSDPCLLSPVLWSDANRGFEYWKLGVNKRAEWSFQREWRFSVYILPRCPEPGNDQALCAHINALYRSHNKPDVKMEYLADIRPEAFEKMQIVLGPRCGPGERAIVEELKATYNPTAIVEDSALTGTIR